MYFPLLALFFSVTALATPADAIDLATPVVDTVTSYTTVIGSADVAVVTSTVSAVAAVIINTLSSYEEAMSIYDSEVDALVPTYPTWVESVLATAIPTTWKEKMMDDPSFLDSVNNAQLSGIMPAWYSSLPSDVKYVMTSDQAVYDSEVATIPVPSFGSVTSTATSGSSITSSSLSSSTMSTTTSGSTAATSKTSETSTSTSTGGAPVATGGLVMSIVGAAGIFGLALAL